MRDIYTRVHFWLYLFFLSSLFLPADTEAASYGSFRDLIMKGALPIIDQISKMLIGIAVLIFFWNVAHNLWGDHSAEKTKKLTTTITWGILILFIMVSIWGILLLLRNTLLYGI